MKKSSLFQLAWPIFLNGVLGIILGFIDVFVLSKVNDLAASAVSAACQITSICSLLISAVCSAACIMIAQYIGKGDRERVSRISTLCIAINVVLGIGIFIVILLFRDTFLVMLGAKEELYHMASEYLKILVWGIVLDAYSSTIGNILYSHGKIKISVMISASMSTFNLILDMFLVLGLCGLPRLEVRGAAIATVITKIIWAVLISLFFFSGTESITIFKLLKEVHLKEVVLVFKLGIPSVFDSMNYSITQLVITGIIFHYLSQNEIIARTYLMNIAAFFNQVTNALASATQIMIGHEIGAGHYEKAESDCYHCLKLSLAATFVISGGAVLFSKQLFGIFTSNQEVLRIGFYLMLVNVMVEMGRAQNVVIIWSLRGAGDVSFPVFIAACCMWVVAVGGSYGIVRLTTLGIIGVWIMSGIDEVVRGLIIIARWKSGKWKEKVLC